MEMPDIVKKCKGYTLKLNHPSIKENEEYQILGFKERNGKFGEFFMLHCYLPKLDKYQRVFSNSKLTSHIFDSMPIWTRYEQDEETGIYVWEQDEKMKFYPGEMRSFNGNQYRKIVFEIE